MQLDATGSSQPDLLSWAEPGWISSSPSNLASNSFGFYKPHILTNAGKIS